MNKEITYSDVMKDCLIYLYGASIFLGIGLLGFLAINYILKPLSDFIQFGFRWGWVN